MSKQLLFEAAKLKAELSFDILKETKEYKHLSPEIQSTMEECYNMGSEYGAALAMTEGSLNENGDVDEGFFDRFKANVSRAGQAVKNITGLGTQTTDSKDAAVNSLLANFQKKFEPLVNKPVETPQQANTPPKIAKAEDDGLNRIQQKVEQDPTPAPSPAEAEKIVVNTPNAPKGLKDKIIAGIRANPGKTKFLLGALAFGAGVAAAAMSGGNPVAAKIAGSLVNGLGNAALAKIQGRSGADAAMSGIGGAIAGAGLAGAGFNMTNWLGSAAERAVDGLHNMLGGGVQVQFPAGHHAAAHANTWADTSDANSSEYQTTQNQINQNDTGVADTSDANSSEYQTTQNQVAQGTDVQPQTAQAASQADSQVAAPVSKGLHPLDPRSARVAFDKARGVVREDDEETEESIFEKGNGNVFKLKKPSTKSLKEARQLQPDAEAALNDFLDDLAKMFGVQGAGTDAGRKAVIEFMKSQGTRFKSVLDYLNKYQLVDGGSAQQQTPELSNNVKNNIGNELKSFFSTMTILNPNIKELKTTNATKTYGATYVLKLNKNGNLSFAIQGRLLKQPVVVQDQAQAAKAFDSLLIKEIKYNNIKGLTDKIIEGLTTAFVAEYGQNPQMTNNMQPAQFAQSIKTYVAARVNSGGEVKKIVDNLMKVCSSALSLMNKSNVNATGIAINQKGTGIKSIGGVAQKQTDLPNGTSVKTKKGNEYIVKDGVWHGKRSGEAVTDPAVVNLLNKLSAQKDNQASNNDKSAPQNKKQNIKQVKSVKPVKVGKPVKPAKPAKPSSTKPVKPDAQGFTKTSTGIRKVYKEDVE